MGAKAARLATEVVIREVQPERVVSVGFAGALDPALKVADIIEPRTVINASDGSRTETGSGQGTLVSYAAVADREQRGKLGRAYGAVAVDMEAAAVAQGAQARGVECGALKAVSDEADFAMPAMESFITDEGRFQTVRFALHVALRPRLWRTTMALAQNSAQASQALCRAMENYLQRETSAADWHQTEGGTGSAGSHPLEKR